MMNAWSDPQFYIVTAIALGGLWRVLRPFLKRSSGQPGCPTCTTCSIRRGSKNEDDTANPSGLVTLGSGRS